MIRRDTIQTIIETARIEEVIGDFVSLKKRGANYVGLCPFHNEKTPSFSVSPSKGIYKCFGCGKAGNVVNFVMEHEHYTYPEALKYLAKRYGIEVEEEEVTPEMQHELDERESMFAVNDFVTKHFQQNLLQTDEGKSVGLSYLKERDFLEATIEKFQLGYALNKRDDYSKNAIRNGYKKEILVKTGLTIDKNGLLIDRFRGRVIFPIHNLTGKVIGFGGRILSAEKTKSTAKYINSPDSDIYNKSKVLYGIYFARNSIVKQNNCYLVEGYTDVISLHQAGIENVVSSSGTSLTVDQIKLIKRYTPNITILYDGDPAGIKASFRGIDLILEQGMNVKIVLFPEGEDPDSFVRSHRTSEVHDFIKNQATDFIKFKTSLMMGETTGDPTGRASLIKEIVNTIAQIPDGINRAVYIKECSTVMNIPEQTLMNELNKTIRKKFSKQNTQQKDVPLPAATVSPVREQIEIDPLDVSGYEKQIMQFILRFAYSTIIVNEDEEDREWQVVDFIIYDFNRDHINFENPVYNKILKEYALASEEGRHLDEKYFTYHDDQEIVQTVIELLAEPYQLSENWKKYKIYPKKGEEDMVEYFYSYILPLKSRLISKELRKIMDLLKTAEDESEMFLLQQQYYELKKIANMLDERRHRIFNH